MSGWNNRVVYHPPSKVEVGKGKKIDEDEYLAIHEVYYDDDGIPNSMTVDGLVIGDEGIDSLHSLRERLECQLEALDRPILSYELKNGKYEEISQEKQNEFIKGIEDEEEDDSEDSSASE